MRVFVYEYSCAAGLGGVAPTLRREGWAMLRAALEDFGRIPGVRTVTLLDERLPDPPQCDVVRVRAEGEEEAFRAAAGSADHAVVIAPEFDGLLERRCRWVEEAGGALLGPSAAAAALAGDKLALGERLGAGGVPTPDCRLDSPALPWEALPYPLVWKPRHGAGSQATFLMGSPKERGRCADAARAEGWQGEAIVQPFVAGQPASVAVLIGPAQQLGLLPASQELSTDGRFRYGGGRLPLPTALAERARSLAQKATASVSGLRGYVGVDLVLGAEADGCQDYVIEINPRLTTSYVGLRQMTATNLAHVWLQVVQGDIVAEPTWREGRLGFLPDGTVTELR
jgi:predicted ATP-grasp superfamily ATP-dependent carboligase